MKRKFHKRHGERLLKLADHIEKMPKGDGHQEGKAGFDFNFIAVKQECGTAACAVGSMPAVWPDKFRYGGDYGKSAENVPSGDYLNVFPRRIRGGVPLSRVMNLTLATRFFGLTGSEANALFIPFNQYGLLGLETMGTNVSGADVAKNIRVFVKNKTECLSRGSQLSE